MTQPSLLSDDVIASEEARTDVGYGRDRWRELLRSNAIPNTRIGRSVFVRRSDVRAYIESQFAENGEQK